MKKRKVFKWLGIVLLSPILLFVLLVILLYIPPIQNWAVKQLTSYASEQTGMQISIEHVDIGFPLDIGADGVLIIQEGDTIADIRRLVADVKLCPLLSGKVELNQVELHQAKLNTREFIGDMCIKGNVNELAFRASPEGFDLNKEVFALNDVRLKDGSLTVQMSDTAAVDTTDVTLMKIKFDKLHVERSHFTILIDSAANFMQPSTTIKAYMGRTDATSGLIDLGLSAYSIEHIDWADGALSYDSLFALSEMKLVADDFLSAGDITKIDFKETHSNLRLMDYDTLEDVEIAGPLVLDADGIRLRDLKIETPGSTVQLMADFDYAALEDSVPNTGQLKVDIDAEIAKSDLMVFMKDTPPMLQTLWPLSQLKVKGSLQGNMQEATIPSLTVTLPQAFELEASGTLHNLYDTDRLLAQLDWKLNAHQLDFLLKPFDLLPPSVRIPAGLSMQGNVDIDGQRYKANILARQRGASLRLNGDINTRSMAYDADIDIHNFNVQQYMTDLPITQLTSSITLRGQGTDFFDHSSWIEADADISRLCYDGMQLDSIQAQARLNDGHALAHVSGDNRLFSGSIDIDALMDSDDFDGTIGADLSRIDLQALGVTEEPLTVGFCGHIDMESDMADRHDISGMIGDIYINDSLAMHRPEDIGLLLKTNNDTTIVRLQSGSLVLKLDSDLPIGQLADKLSLLGDSLSSQMAQKAIDQPQLKTMLPNTRISMSSGRDNPLADILEASADIRFKDMKLDLTTSATDGINGQGHIHALTIDSTRIDTIRINLKDTPTGLTYQGRIANNRRNPSLVFTALVDGHVYDRGASIGLRFYDRNDELGVRIGAYATAEDDGIHFRLVPDRPTLGYKEFSLNKDNFLFISNSKKLFAKVDLIADDGTGVKVYSESQDSTLLQDLTISLNRFDLQQLTSSIPFLPNISGLLNGDFHLMMNQQSQISVASDMNIRNMGYEGVEMGNISSEFVYLQREDDTHAVQAVLYKNDTEIGTLNGEYKAEGEGMLNANLTLTRLPMELANGFIPDQLFGFDGYAEGQMAIKGAMNNLDVDGEVYLDSAHIFSLPYGVNLRFDNDPVRIIDAKLLLENFTMYAFNDNPLNIMGEIDFHDISNMKMNLRMRAQNFQLINSKQTTNSVTYGKMFVNFYATMNGPMDHLKMRSKLDILGTTNLNYILLDSPLSTDNQMDELVKFTDFNDTTQTVVERPVPDGLDVDMNISIDQGAHIRCDLNVDQTNYVDLYGGGDLRMRYNSDGLALNGRYTLGSGQMKYSLPVIPLKTFTIQDGSYVEFTGAPGNPTLNITATERTRAEVGSEGQETRQVSFDCGVVITKTLQNMGLEFIISAPQDLSVNSELNTMSKEERGKLAVTMLTTGMYLNDGNTSGFSLNTALNNFLEREINQITGNALKTIDLDIGLNNTTDASGQLRTDYSFKFAKRFWNNRLKVQLGGKVSTGANVPENQTIFNNVTMEYRLSPTANQYVKLFYNQNAYDWLDGYTEEYGGGFIWKRKLERFWDIFRHTPKGPTRNPSRREGGQDSIKIVPNDSIKHTRQ